MAEMFKANLVFAFILVYFTLIAGGDISHAVDVAAGKTGKAFSNHIKNDSSPGFAVDGNTTTCMETEQEKNTIWTLDLSQLRVVTGVRITPDSQLGFIEIYVSNDPSGMGDICQYASSVLEEQYISCRSAIAGQYVKITNLKKTGLKICELQVMECEEGYYGLGCIGECHCLSDEQACNRMTGRCPAGCASGFTGQNCSQPCTNNSFGPNCAQQCHCAANQPCDSVDGTCSNGCDQGWQGSDCQTQVPVMTEAPVLVQKESDSIKLKWPSWTGAISDGFSVKYLIQYLEHRTDKWMSGAEKIMVAGTEFQEAVVSRLKLNTYYRFRILPSLLEDGNIVQEGDWGPSSNPFKTACIVPDPPTILDLIAGSEMDRDPPFATITVKWEKPPDDGIRCDAIAYYKINYSKKNSTVWSSAKASAASTERTIEGLEFGALYQVMVVAVNNEDFGGQSGMQRVSTAHSDYVGPGDTTKPGRSDLGLIIAGALIALLVLSAVVVIFIIAYRCKTRGRRVRRSKAQYATVPPKDKDTAENGEVTLHQLVPLDKERTPTNDSGILVEAGYKHTPSSSADSFNHVKPPTPEPVPRPREHFPINLDDLEDYVMQRRDNDSKALKEEYKEFPEGPQLPWDHGKSRENKHKNRFINIIAYDHSRVVMDVLEGDPDSDYINANYVNGYEKEKYYIASQGCNKYTTQDMWRMAWQENCLRIVMVTNLVENGKRKCEQYWPEHMNEERPYGQLTVTWIDTEQTSDFCIRTFLVKYGEESRNIKQFHFTAWPDHGVPTRAAPIIAFRRKVRSFDDTHPGRTIVHCSAGVGRTGTYMAIDYLLERAKAERKVDLYNLTKYMRGCRVNMIQTEEQYVFVYDALLEALKTGDTAIQCSEFRIEFERLLQVEPDTEEEEEEGVVQPHNDGKSRLQKQFENLQSVSPRIKKEDCQAGAQPDNVEKNKNQQILPADRHRPYLMTKVQGTNDYINAVFLDGYKSRNSHIITQMPLPHTVIDFWRMVHEHNVGSVVMLNPFNPEDESLGQYWPDDTACECGPFIIEPVSVNTDKIDVTVRELRLTFQNMSPESGRKYGDTKERTVNLFQYMAWRTDSNVPASKTSLMSLIDMVEKSQFKTGNGPVLIHCLDGASQSGLYAAISCIWEKMKLEQEVDIFHTVKHLRYHRPQVVQNLEQYKFCFEMVLAFLAEFETYANFTWRGDCDSSPDSD